MATARKCYSAATTNFVKGVYETHPERHRLLIRSVSLKESQNNPSLLQAQLLLTSTVALWKLSSILKISVASDASGYHWSETIQNRYEHSLEITVKQYTRETKRIITCQPGILIGWVHQTKDFNWWMLARNLMMWETGARWCLTRELQSPRARKLRTKRPVAGFCNSLSCRTVRFVKRGNEVYRSVPTSP